MQLFQVFRKLFVRRFDEGISRAEHLICVLGDTVKVRDHVLQVVHVHFKRIGQWPQFRREFTKIFFQTGDSHIEIIEQLVRILEQWPGFRRDLPQSAAASVASVHV